MEIEFTAGLLGCTQSHTNGFVREKQAMINVHRVLIEALKQDIKNKNLIATQQS
jgi:hypothetical protein